MSLPDADIAVDPADLELDPVSARSRSRRRDDPRRNLEVLREYAAPAAQGKPRAVVPALPVSRPVELLGDGRVEALRGRRNRLEADESGRLRAVPPARPR